MPSNRQSVYASVAHRYWNSQWTPEKNRQIYGLDASEEGLGSNLRLEVEWEGDSAPAIAALAHLKALVDHQCLFTQFENFKQRPSTLENITVFLGEEWRKFKLTDARWMALTVWESDGLGARFSINGELELIVKELNLEMTLKGPVDGESGWIVDRRSVREAVRACFLTFGGQVMVDRDAWAQSLFSNLKRSISLLKGLRVDLGRHEYLHAP